MAVNLPCNLQQYPIPLVATALQRLLATDVGGLKASLESARRPSKGWRFPVRFTVHLHAFCQLKFLLLPQVRGHLFLQRSCTHSRRSAFLSLRPFPSIIIQGNDILFTIPSTLIDRKMAEKFSQVRWSVAGRLCDRVAAAANVPRAARRRGGGAVPTVRCLEKARVMGQVWTVQWRLVPPRAVARLAAAPSPRHHKDPPDMPLEQQNTIKGVCSDVNGSPSQSGGASYASLR